MLRCSQRLRGQALGRGGSHCWGVAADKSLRLTLALWGGGRQDLANHKHEHDRRTRVSQRTAEANKTVECWGPGWRRSAGGQEGLPGGGGIYATTGRSGHWCWGSRVFFPQSIENTRTLESPAALCPWSGGPDGGRRLVTCWVMRPSLPLGSPGHLGPCVPWDLEASPLLRCHPGTAWEAMPTQVGGVREGLLWTGCGGASQRLFLRPRGQHGTYRPLAPGSAGPFTLTAHDMGLPDDRAEVGVNGGRSSQSGGRWSAGGEGCVG